MIQRSALIGISLAIAFASVLAGCGGGGYTTQRIVTGGGLIISLPGGGSTLSIVAPATGAFSVSETGYTGAFTASSANPAIAIIGLANVFSAARRSADAQATSAGQNSVTFTVAGIGNGTTSIIVSDAIGHSAAFTVVVSGFAPAPTPTPTPIVMPIVTMPEAIALSAIAQSQGVAVSEAGYSGTFAATSDNPTVASVAPATGSASFIVTAVGPGSANITFKDTNNATATVTVRVTTGSGSVSLLYPELGPQAE